MELGKWKAGVFEDGRVRKFGKEDCEDLVWTERVMAEKLGVILLAFRRWY